MGDLNANTANLTFTSFSDDKDGETKEKYEDLRIEQRHVRTRIKKKPTGRNNKEFIEEPTEKQQRKPTKNGEPTHRKTTNLPKKTDDKSSENRRRLTPRNDEFTRRTHKKTTKSPE
ncbi:25202_t:CDS:2 [Dentiscutata erythropus]|uniref:25202_t:CDS:1 n=1 Tax=Dentiscutata erythropus TaxID=1348616 RepID=A0A9N8ZAN3_9GLOM|nr:25202_t:CDS:2 [Dentiscutata erythropus]